MLGCFLQFLCHRRLHVLYSIFYAIVITIVAVVILNNTIIAVIIVFAIRTFTITITLALTIIFLLNILSIEVAFSLLTFALFFGCVKLSQNDLDNEIDDMCLTADPISNL